MRWWSDRALAQLTPVGDVRWDGYVIQHEWRWESDLASQGDLHHVRILRGDSQVMDEHVYVRESDFLVGPVGFFGGLDVDEDADLELVFCQDGVVEAIIEPDRIRDILARHPVGYATPRARELCATVEHAGSRPAFSCVVCCVTPFALPAFIAILILARRERREEDRTGRTTF